MKKYIPSLFTSINLVCGFLAITMGDFYYSSILLLCGILFDALDGIAARAFNAQSALGKELDSLADLVSFGIAPAYLYFLLSPLDHWVGYLPAILLVLGSALRLAKFNIIESSKHFYGLPTPATAFFLIGIFIGYHYENDLIIQIIQNQILYALIAVFFAFMMLSRLRMFSLKGINEGFAENKLQILMLSIFIILLIVNTKLAIPISVMIYILLSIIENMAFNRK